MLSAEEFFDRACELLAAEGSTHRDFEDALRGKKVLLCLDEFEQTTDNPAFGEEYFNVLRSLAQTGELALVVATQHTLSELYRSGAITTSPFFNIFSVLRLGPLTEAEARELVTRPIEHTTQAFSESEVSFILHLAGAHPYRLHVACELLYEAKLNGRADFTEVRRRFEEEAVKKREASSATSHRHDRQRQMDRNVVGQRFDACSYVSNLAEREHQESVWPLYGRRIDAHSRLVICD